MNLKDFLLDIIFPPLCLFCGKHLGLSTRPLVCGKCHEKYDAYEKVCARCGSHFDYESGLPVCHTCHSSRHPFDGVVSAYYYKDGVRRAIIEHKFDFKHNNAPSLSEYVSDIIKETFNKNKPDYIIYVPSSKTRLRERGYDSLYEIAEIVSEKCDIPLLDKTLIKTKDTPQQSTKTYRGRLRNVRGSFGIKHKEKVKNGKFIIFDDVYTSGATTRECAKVLKRAGASYIMIVTVAISTRFKR